MTLLGAAVASTPSSLTAGHHTAETTGNDAILHVDAAITSPVVAAAKPVSATLHSMDAIITSNAVALHQLAAAANYELQAAAAIGSVGGAAATVKREFTAAAAHASSISAAGDWGGVRRDLSV